MNCVKIDNAILRRNLIWVSRQQGGIVLRRTFGIWGSTALCGASRIAAAQGGSRSFAVLSEVARDVKVVTFQESTGTLLNANLISRIAIPQGALDKVALVSAKQALEKIDKDAPVWLIAPLDSDLFDAQGVYVEGRKVALPSDLSAEMRQRGTTHLLLFTRVRADAELRALNSHLGSGQIEGLGFFVDKQTMMKDNDTLVTSRGFIAPYLYMRATVIDATSGVILATRRITEGYVLAAGRPDQSGDPWGVLSAADKVRHLADLLQRQVKELVPPLLAPR